jgi:O-acetyl-ADP-ribose deacetylase (regulator of RNase III)
MLTFTSGDILRANAEALVNTVNCVGVMGRGIALQFKTAFPANFKAYEAACRRTEVQPGQMLVVATGRLTNPKYIINFPTKRHWRGQSRMEDIESGLRALVSEVRDRHIRSIAVPPLGSGLGGLPWLEVRQRIIAVMSELKDTEVTVYEPNSTAHPSLAVSSKVPTMTPGRAALVLLMDGYLRGLMDPEVSLLEVHKLMYFLQEAGEPLRLQYAKAPYGPYAENLTHVLRAVEGHLVSGYSDGGDNPAKLLHLVPGAAKDSASFLEGRNETAARFRRVMELVDGWETAFGLELLATVHWVATRENAQTPEAAVAKTYAWNPRKQRFSEAQIALALHELARKHWIPDARQVAIA